MKRGTSAFSSRVGLIPVAKLLSQNRGKVLFSSRRAQSFPAEICTESGDNRHSERRDGIKSLFQCSLRPAMSKTRRGGSMSKAPDVSHLSDAIFLAELIHLVDKDVPVANATIERSRAAAIRARSELREHLVKRCETQTDTRRFVHESDAWSFSWQSPSSFRSSKRLKS